MFKLSAATLASIVAADDSVTMFLADSGHAASMWQDERDFESSIRRVLQLQTADLEKLAAAHPSSSLLQTEVALQQVESLADTIHLAADSTKALSGSDSINACNYARAGALEAYNKVNGIVSGMAGSSGYGSASAQEDALWEQVKATTLRCRIIGDPAVFAASSAMLLESSDLPVVEVSLAGAGSWSNALVAMEKNREQMENRFVAQLQQKVSALEKSSAPTTAKAISNVLDLNTALFQTEKAARHASLMEAPTSLRVRVSDSAAAAELVDMVAKHEAKLNAREEELFRSALVALETGAAPSSMFLESERSGDQEFAVKVTGSGSLAFVDTVKQMNERRATKLREVRNFVSGVVAQLSQQ